MRILEEAKRLVYIAGGFNKGVYVANFLTALEGKRTDKVAVVQIGKRVDFPVNEALRYLSERGFVKRHLTVTAQSMNSFEILKTTKFVFL